MGEWRRPATGRARRAVRHCDVRLRDILRVERGREGKLDIGRADLQRVLLTSILWPVNRGALWESVIRCPPHPTLSARLPAAHTTSFYWSLWMWGFRRRFTTIHPGILSQPDCRTSTDIPICYWIPPTRFPFIRIPPPSLTCCCPRVSCGEASKRQCPP